VSLTGEDWGDWHGVSPSGQGLEAFAYLSANAMDKNQTHSDSKVSARVHSCQPCMAACRLSEHWLQASSDTTTLPDKFSLTVQDTCVNVLKRWRPLSQRRIH
jgi:hypothetical protein